MSSLILHSLCAEERDREREGEAISRVRAKASAPAVDGGGEGRVRRVAGGGGVQRQGAAGSALLPQRRWRRGGSGGGGQGEEPAAHVLHGSQPVRQISHVQAASHALLALFVVAAAAGALVQVALQEGGHRLVVFPCFGYAAQKFNFDV